ncbi:DUF6470 family protein [Paenibacillus glycanilyticus]|uniref:DUF6470 family protein n=1 Tax=Paenibacillus glycanilyticus TaxID=126569 RepID=UPI00203C22C6|nr:DUF6470 family protein [Paenibacillus glycanilyticus]MCM3628109.1 DUF6470 family protein [Paenibacillus glycanilyticus]
MTIGHIQIHQQPALIGIQVRPAEQRIEQPQATMDMRQIPAKLSIEQPMGVLEVNQERAWDGLGLANNLEVSSRIYSQAKELALQGVARRMQEGRQLADLAHVKSNPIPEIAKNWRKEGPELPVAGPASIDNVDVSFTPGKVQIEVEEGGVDLRVTPNRPIHDYTPGKAEIYMRQYASVQITPPSIDTML